MTPDSERPAETTPAIPRGGGCRACLELEDKPHDCPLPLARVTAGGAS
jgi:hypothetical protein